MTLSALIAIIASVAVVLGFVTSILGLINQSRIKRTAGEIQNISVQVDGRLSALLERQAQLLGALHESGTPVPPRPAETTAEGK